MSVEIPELKTERLLLRALTMDDAEALFSYAKNPNVSKYTMWEPHETIEDTKEFLREYAFKKYAEGEIEPLGIYLKTDPQRLIGTTGCLVSSEKSRRMELMYVLAEEYWGQGITVEASRAVMDYAFKNLNANRIQAVHKKENPASGRVMQKLGMTYEGCRRQAVFHRGRFWDMESYAVLQEEWDV